MAINTFYAKNFHDFISYNYIINNIAKSLGGGGHKFAAGAMTDGSPDIVLQKVLNLTFNELVKQSEVKN